MPKRQKRRRKIYASSAAGNDLFVTVGAVLLMAGFYFVLNTLLAGRTLPVAAALAVVLWVVAEIVTRQHRMKLSSTVLSLFFMAAAVACLSILVLERYPVREPSNLFELLALRSTVQPAAYLFVGGTIGAAGGLFLALSRADPGGRHCDRRHAARLPSDRADSL
jgi:drug/metabolite transporter (DMT)-like permease